MPKITTVGRLLVNDALPDDLRVDGVLDKKSLHKLFMTVAEKHPEAYKEILRQISDVGRMAVFTEGSTVSLAKLVSRKKQELLRPARQQIQMILDNDSMSDARRKEAIVEVLSGLSKPLQETIMQEARDRRSPFADQIDSGARGNKSGLSSIMGADLLATDQRDQFVPIPLDRSYAEGYTPAQYFAASFGQRKGQLAVKLAVADAGYYTKRLVNAAHRLVVNRDAPEPTRLPTGLPVDVGDRDNIGAVLALDAGEYPAGTVITDSIQRRLQDAGYKEVLIHSPLTELSEDGGISKLAAGRRWRGRMADIGDSVGVTAAEAIGERLSQGTLGAKHSAGVSDRVSRAGFEYLNRMLESPEHFPEAGPLAEADGVVGDIRPAPQGGTYVKVGDREYYLNADVKPTVKVGDQLEVGDDLSDGLPNPRDLVRLRGLGEARRTYLRYLKEGLENSGVPTHRRNAEAVVSGVLNWLRVTNPDGLNDALYDDVVPAGRVLANYTPRPTAKLVEPRHARGKYLEERALHYTPGTRITRRVQEDLERWGIRDVHAHDDPPDFEPEMIRGIESVYYDPDWQTQLAGFYTGKAFERSLHRGATSDASSTSFYPALVEGRNFGRPLQQTGKYASLLDSPLGMALKRR